MKDKFHIMKAALIGKSLKPVLHRRWCSKEMSADVNLPTGTSAYKHFAPTLRIIRLADTNLLSSVYSCCQKFLINSFLLRKKKYNKINRTWGLMQFFFAKYHYNTNSVSYNCSIFCLHAEKHIKLSVFEEQFGLSRVA